MHKGTLVRNENGIWMVRWSDLHSFSHGTHWSFTELSSDSNSIKFIKDNEIKYKPLEEGLEVEFKFNFNHLYAILVFPEVDNFEKEERIKEYVKNNGDLFLITDIDTIRDGGTTGIITSKNKKIYIHKDNWTLQNEYPTTDDNIIRDEATQVYILERIERYKEICERKLYLVDNIIDKINKKNENN